MDGMLYLCATPIGNLEDITLRVLNTLKECDCVYCEDTRHSLGLLNHFEIKKPLFSCHEHNEREKSEEILARVKNGEKVAYVSDAGMPGISDPGGVLLRAAADAGIPCTVLPGASALPMAAVLCGLDTARFTFAGFLPRDKKPRREAIGELFSSPYPVIFYESPLRAAATLQELYELLGDRPASLMRELTKLHEETVRGTLASLAERFAETPPRGECVIAVGGKPEEEEAARSPEELIRHLLSGGMRVKDAAKQASAVLDIPRNDAYELALKLSKE